MSIKISELTAAGALTGTELVPVVQSGATKRTTTQDIADLGGAGSGYTVYTATLAATAGNAPTETVVHADTIGGTISYGYNGVGQYPITRTGDFALGKVWCSVNAQGDDSFTMYPAMVYEVGDGTLLLVVSGGSLGDYLRIMIEIRVYP